MSGLCKFFNVPLQRKQFLDIYIIIENAESIQILLILIKEAIYFGVDRDGVIHGQPGLTRNKRYYIKREIGERIHHFTPDIDNKLYEVKFKQVVDDEGDEIPDTFVIVLELAMISFGDNMDKHQRWHFKTSQQISYYIKGEGEKMMIYEQQHDPY